MRIGRSRLSSTWDGRLGTRICTVPRRVVRLRQSGGYRGIASNTLPKAPMPLRARPRWSAAIPRNSHTTSPGWLRDAPPEPAALRPRVAPESAGPGQSTSRRAFVPGTPSAGSRHCAPRIRTRSGVGPQPWYPKCSDTARRFTVVDAVAERMTIPFAGSMRCRMVPSAQEIPHHLSYGIDPDLVCLRLYRPRSPVSIGQRRSVTD